MSLETIFYILGGLTIGTALMVVLSKHPVRSVLYLVVTFFLISANYVLMNAQFIAVVNIIVYAGAIMVLFLFVLMLLNLNKENEPHSSGIMAFGAVIAAGSLFVTVIAALKDSQIAAPVVGDAADTIGLAESLGRVLFTKYVLPFEVSSVLFLAAMVGAVLLGKREKLTNE